MGKKKENWMYITDWFVGIYYFIRSLRLKIHLFILKGEINRKHVTFRRNGFNFEIVVQNHWDFVRDTIQRIVAFEKGHSEEEIIIYSLEQALGGCNTITFVKGRKEIRFYTFERRIDLYINLKKNNKQSKYYYQILGVLSSINFHKDSIGYVLLGKRKTDEVHFLYKIEGEGPSQFLNAYFQKNTSCAAQFVLIYFKDVLGVKSGKMRMTVS